MNIPSLPTDTISRLFVIGSIIILVIFFGVKWNDDSLRTKLLQQQSSLRDTNQVYSAEIARLKDFENNYELPLVALANAQTISGLAASGKPSAFILKGDTLKPLPSTAVLGQLQNSPLQQQGRILFPTISAEVQFRQDSIAHMKARIESLKNERDKKLAAISADIDNMNHQLTVNNIVRYTIMIVAGIAFIIGFARWWRTDNWKEKILFQEYKKALGSEVPCQSCGMKLKYDKEHQENDIYCHDCFDGFDFVDPAMTLKEMKRKIRSRMKDQGFHRWQIWRHNRKLVSYTRWSKEFKW